MEKVGKYKEYEMVLILCKGVIWVKVDEDVLVGENVKVLLIGNFGKVIISFDLVMILLDIVIGIFKIIVLVGNLVVL